ncbi:MAG: ferredoxin reductase family protein [Micropruina sp.]
MTTLHDRPRTAPVAPPDPRPSIAQRYAAQARARNWRADGLEFVGWVSMAVSVALFLADGGAAQFGSISDAFSSVGILAGLTSTNALLLMLLLAARIPVIDATLGQPRATSLHAKLGQWVVIGLVIHTMFLIAGYAMSASATWLAQFLYFWGATADFGWAVLGMVLFLVISFTSVAAARKKLPYEVWHAIHLASYVAVGASIPHMFSMSGLFATNAVARWYWIVLLALTGLALLVFRLGIPLLSTLDSRLTVSRVTQVTPDVINIEVTGRRVADLGARAGQYFHWRFLAPGLWWHQHPFSISAAPSANTLRITVRNLGKGTAALMNVRPGTLVAIEGPYGTFSDAARTTPDVVMIGAGVGIAPIRALLEETAIIPGRAAVVLRASRPEELYLLHEITELCRRRGAALITLVGPRARIDLQGTTRWVPQHQANLSLTQIAPYLAEADVFVCGPDGFTDAVIADLKGHGVPDSRIHEERFVW